MSAKLMTITVPGSSANLGPGFDSVGIAVDRYLHLDVYLAKTWHFEALSNEMDGLPTGKENLLYKVANAVAHDKGGDLPPCHVHMNSDIPLARGLGSSAAAIVAGIELADALLKLDMSKEEKLRFASLWEGHPDNVGPCLYGGLTIGVHTEDKTEVVKQHFENVDLIFMIPNDELLTAKARAVLPETLEYKEAVQASATANVLVAALITKDWALVGKMMGEDRLHQPYRSAIIPGLAEALQDVKTHGVYGAALSGAGPTILCFAPYGAGEEIAERIQKQYPNYIVTAARPDTTGATVHRSSQSAQAL